MGSLSVRELNANISKALARVEAGEVLDIKKNGRVIAELRPKRPVRDAVWRKADEESMDFLRKGLPLGIGKVHRRGQIWGCEFVIFTMDSNVLVYAVDSQTPEKQTIARNIMRRAPGLEAVLTCQAVAEFLNVVRRRAPASFSVAREQAARWATIFPIAGTSWECIARAAAMADVHKLQLWNCVIWQAARSLQAQIFISEDIQDGFSAEGMSVLNPFKPSNAERLAMLLEEGASPG